MNAIYQAHERTDYCSTKQTELTTDPRINSCIAGPGLDQLNPIDHPNASISLNTS